MIWITSQQESEFLDKTADIRAKLDSTEIDFSKPYVQQLETVKSCLEEAFWEYANKMEITNRFFLVLGFFMDRLKDFQAFKWDKNSKEHQILLNDLVWAWNGLRWYIIDNFSSALDKIELDLGFEEEAINKLKLMQDDFIRLLTEKIKYENPLWEAVASILSITWK